MKPPAACGCVLLAFLVACVPVAVACACCCFWAADRRLQNVNNNFFTIDWSLLTSTNSPPNFSSSPPLSPTTLRGHTPLGLN